MLVLFMSSYNPAKRKRAAATTISDPINGFPTNPGAARKSRNTQSAK
jgi:hypothetical protein